jgi:hypothetical protein
MIPVLMIVASIIILVHCICMASKLNRRNWHGHMLKFAGLAFSYALQAGGALAAAAGWHMAITLLMLGGALRVLFDRRNRT